MEGIQLKDVGTAVKLWTEHGLGSLAEYDDTVWGSLAAVYLPEPNTSHPQRPQADGTSSMPSRSHGDGTYSALPVSDSSLEDIEHEPQRYDDSTQINGTG